MLLISFLQGGRAHAVLWRQQMLAAGRQFGVSEFFSSGARGEGAGGPRVPHARTPLVGSVRVCVICFVGFFWVLLGPAGFCWVLLGPVGFCWVLLGLVFPGI